jgi:hypothetical protein
MYNKYYIPTHEEFHVGFEFEFNHTDINSEIRTGFEKLVVLPEENHNEKLGYSTPGWIEMFYRIFKTDEDKELVIRVKYLDSDDIQSLGFKLVRKFETSNIVEWIFEKEYNEYELNIQLLYPLNLDKQDCHFEIDNVYIFTTDKVRNPDNENCIFDGTVKNKSNLKQILVNNLHYKI